MHQNTFSNTPEVNKIISLWLDSGGLEERKCIKTRFQALQTLKNNFLRIFILVVWKYAQMHKNTFLATPDVKKFFLRT
jgi:hypothetical protein